MLSFLIDVQNIWNAAITNTTSSSEVDTSVFLGDLFINLNARSGGTGSGAVTVEHSEVSGSGFASIPASALFNPETGAAATFTTITTTGTNERLAVNRQQLKRYLRITVTGTTSQNMAATVSGQRQYTGNYSN